MEIVYHVIIMQVLEIVVSVMAKLATRILTAPQKHVLVDYVSNVTQMLVQLVEMINVVKIVTVLQEPVSVLHVSPVIIMGDPSAIISPVAVIVTVPLVLVIMETV